VKMLRTVKGSLCHSSRERCKELGSGRSMHAMKTIPAATLDVRCATL
jgi:hypothetical protein